MIDIQYRSAVQLVRAIDAFGAQPSGGLIVGPATTRIDAGTILELAAQYRLPTIHANREFAENGGLISYGGNPLALWARACATSQQRSSRPPSPLFTRRLRPMRTVRECDCPARCG